jgi:uncharacterized protein (TIGR03435 family)
MRDRFVISLVAGLLMVAGTGFGQTAAKGPTFDVATVKPSAPLDMAKLAQQVQAGEMPNLGPKIGPSQATFNYMSLKDLIALAYKLKPFQVTGPEWMGSQRFDIAAKMPDGASKDDVPAMLQALLKERFALVSHMESREHPVLALVVGKNGPKLKKATITPKAIDENTPLKAGEMTANGADGPVRVTRSKDGASAVMDMGTKGVITQRMDMATKTMHIDSDGVTMAGFADALTRVLQMGGASNRQVVDQTGLKGHYQTSVEISLADLMNMMKQAGMQMGGAGTAEDPSGDGDNGSSIYQSVEALGLKLESSKAKVDQLVVDSVSKTPTEN